MAAQESPHTTIWLARHGEVHNPGNIFYGRLPRMRLSPKGRDEVAALAAFLARRDLAAVYSSPLLRARKTALAIQARQPAAPLRVDQGLHEVRSGWQGSTWTDLAAISHDFYANRRGPDDETVPAIRDRMLDWVRRMLRRHAGQEIAGVSHGDPVLIAVAALKGLPMEASHFRPAAYIPTATVFRLDFDREGTFLRSEMAVPHQQAAA